MLNALLRKYFGKTTSKEIAKKRLKLALIYDKTEVSDDILSDLQRDIMDVISRYFIIDKSGIKLDIQRSDDLSALVFNSPILSAKRGEQEPTLQ